MSTFGVCGAGGRMGRSIVRSIDTKSHTVGMSFDVDSSPCFGKDPLFEELGKQSGASVVSISSENLKSLDAVIDFSAPSATIKLLDAAIQAKCAMVIATTGLDDESEAKIKEASKTIAIVRATNMSVGVNLLFKLVKLAAQALGGEYDAEVFEAHHKHKKDSPSGTASTIIRSIRDGHSAYAKADEAYRNRGIIGERSANEIGVQVLRGGDIVGEHTAFFCGEGERIEITHRATDRKIFADGAVRAAEFASLAKPGLYSMFDVLNIGE